MGQENTQVAPIQYSGEVLAPDQFIAKAIESGSDVSVLSGLFDLKQRHDAAEAKKAFNRAMLRFQTEKPEIKKDREVSYGGGKAAYSYATLQHIEETIKETLEDCGLSYRWESVQKDGAHGQRCVVTHVLGHSESNEMFAPNDDSGNKNQVQALGSTTSYLKRYTLIGVLGLTSADEDDDGKASGDQPYLQLLKHNEALRRHFHAVGEIKAAIGAKEYGYGVELAYGIGKDDLMALWLAPTKGGIFTTEERKTMKEDPDWLAERDAYFKEQQGD